MSWESPIRWDYVTTGDTPVWWVIHTDPGTDDMRKIAEVYDERLANRIAAMNPDYHTFLWHAKLGKSAA